MKAKKGNKFTLDACRRKVAKRITEIVGFLKPTIKRNLIDVRRGNFY